MMPLRGDVVGTLACYPCDLEGKTDTCVAWVTMTCGRHALAVCAYHAKMHLHGIARLHCDECGR